MKKLLLLGVACIATALFTACTQQPANKFTVKGNISGLNDGDTIMMALGSVHFDEVLDKTVVKDGQFLFEGSIDEPRCINLRIKDSYGWAKFMLENADIEINGTANLSPSYDGKPSYTYDVKVIGSPLTDQLMNMFSVKDSLNNVRKEFMVRYKEVLDAHSNAYRSKDKKIIAEVESSETFLQMRKEDSEFFRTMRESNNKVVMDNKDSFWGPMMLLEFSNYLTSNDKKTYELFSQEAKDSYYGQAVKDELYPVGLIGDPVKPFTVKDAEGKEVTLASLLEGKKYVLIDFWASWCGPCRREIPNLKKQYKDFKDKGFDIISISTDNSEEEWQKALKEEGLEWPNFRDRQVATLYKVKMIPTMYLIDAQGTLVGENLRGEALAKKLEELFQ